MCKIEQLIHELQSEIQGISDVNQKIDTINWIRRQIHEVSPLNHHPVDCVMWVKSQNVEGNDYNPNHVDKQAMKGLLQSIRASGYTMGVVGDTDSSFSVSLNRFIENTKNFFVEIVDGFHRRKSERTVKEISESTFGRVPISFIRNEEKSRAKRIAATVLHNRARGVHEIEKMVGLVVELVQEGLSDSEIAVVMNMDADEVLRLKQTSGIAEIFKTLNYTQSWQFKEISKDSE